MGFIVALLSMLLMSALGAALVLTTTSETLIASNFRESLDGQYAADAALQRATDDLAVIADWNSVLGGLTQSTFVDGPPSGVRTLADGFNLDLDRSRNLLNCRKPASCTQSDLNAVTSERPWGANNPNWRLFAYGRLSSWLPASDSPQYVVVLVADDPAENDDDPMQDGIDATNPGAGTIQLRAEAFGPRGVHQVIGTTLTRIGTPRAVRVLSWRLLSHP
ncbi:MAG TPA: PilX N-terminal domain-containing pilus assembly protein [Vicinamibacterales bacterium]|jgi:hypothetical protein|nr:PilX N-terminal domain-containing pilus assembly protein [Vicinamibacterales bacterium]